MLHQSELDDRKDLGSSPILIVPGVVNETQEQEKKCSFSVRLEKNFRTTIRTSILEELLRTGLFHS